MKEVKFSFNIRVASDYRSLTHLHHKEIGKKAHISRKKLSKKSIEIKKLSYFSIVKMLVWSIHNIGKGRNRAYVYDYHANGLKQICILFFNI